MVVVAPLQAQRTQRTRKVAVRLICNSEPEKVFIVLRGDDKKKNELRGRDDSGRWIGLISGEAIWSDKTEASLRLQFSNKVVRRTNCALSVDEVDPADRDRSVAAFEFDCDTLSVRQVKFEADPEDFPLGWVRRLPGCQPESAYYDNGLQTIQGWRYKTERVDLKIGKDNRKPPDGPGLLVKDVIAASEHVKAGQPKPLQSGKITFMLAKQRVKGKSGSAPNLSLTAIAIDKKKMSGLTSITVTEE